MDMKNARLPIRTVLHAALTACLAGPIGILVSAIFNPGLLILIFFFTHNPRILGMFFGLVIMFGGPPAILVLPTVWTLCEKRILDWKYYELICAVAGGTAIILMFIVSDVVHPRNDFRTPVVRIVEALPFVLGGLGSGYICARIFRRLHVGRW